MDQSRRVDEIVVSDDASTDGTLAIASDRLERAASRGIAVSLLENPRPLGISANFVRALEACTGDVVALSDQDDFWHPGKVEVLAGRLESAPDLLLIGSDARIVDAAGQPTGSTLLEWLDVRHDDLVAIRGEGAFGRLLRRNFFTGATVALRRSLVDVAAPVPEDWVHDEWLAIIAAAIAGVDIVESPLVDYRQHGANQIGVSRPTLRRKVARVLEPGAERNRRLARRSESLVERLEALGAAFASERLALARAKLDHESFRVGLSRRRIARVAPVLRHAATGAYRRFGSQGTLDVVRDLVQPL